MYLKKVFMIGSEYFKEIRTVHAGPYLYRLRHFNRERYDFVKYKKVGFNWREIKKHSFRTHSKTFTLREKYAVEHFERFIKKERENEQTTNY